MKARHYVLAAALIAVITPTILFTQVITEAPAGFDNKTNGFTTQATMDADRATFEEFETIADGLGPVYNAQSCRECHQNPVTGAGSQVTELRAAPSSTTNFADGSLINDRAIDASIQEHVPTNATVAALRSSLNTLGDGFVEAIANQTLQQLALNSGGQLIAVNILEAPGQQRFGRFGWKTQHASLLSFAGDAYLNEMGITNRLFPTENTSNGRSVAAFDTVPDPEDVNDIDAFARFMRSTKVPPRGPITAAVNAGANVFNAIGCNSCHVTSVTTAATGTQIAGFGPGGGLGPLPAALGNKTIHPYSDFALHDIGTGDGITQGAAPPNKMRTAPLWGLRTRDRFMHNLLKVTLTDAINSHDNEAAINRALFNSLSATDRNNLLAFLNSL
jgi:CxxC motif-containing protein (DUF1111 family)